MLLSKEEEEVRDGTREIRERPRRNACHAQTVRDSNLKFNGHEDRGPTQPDKKNQPSKLRGSSARTVPVMRLEKKYETLRITDAIRF